MHPSQDTGIKSDQVQWARSWDGIEARISRELKTEVETDKGKAGIFYKACMDTATVEVGGGLRSCALAQVCACVHGSLRRKMKTTTSGQDVLQCVHTDSDW